MQELSLFRPKIFYLQYSFYKRPQFLFNEREAIFIKR